MLLNKTYVAPFERPPVVVQASLAASPAPVAITSGRARLKRKARATGAGTNAAGDHLRMPGISVVYRLFKKCGSKENRWRAALAEVGLTEMESPWPGRSASKGVKKPPARLLAGKIERPFEQW